MVGIHMIDLTRACRRTADVLAAVTDDQLSAPTPCEEMRLDELLVHIGGLCLAFTAAARKEFGPLTDTPPQVGGLIALTEVVVHGWDVARATGQPYDVDAATAAAVLPHVTQSAAEGPVEGLFGPAVPVSDDAPVLDRIVGLTGRDPGWPTR